MSGGLIKGMPDGAAMASAYEQATKYREGQDDVCWVCGASLNQPDEVQSPRTDHEVIHALALRFVEDPQMWTVAMVLVANPGFNDREIAGMSGMCKTKVNEARRRLRIVHPSLAGAIDDTDHFVAGQRARRETEGTSRRPPPPLVGTLLWRVRSRFAPRAQHSPAKGGAEMDNTGKLADLVRKA